ncbi:uncharacterized protein LOC125955445 [Anopheles darlingi]|uniref:uncharacterized protein LOC125955445 n=1 Tax=Anopheles darlingi TaxID=43151 RepID=UPI002100065A|nr:uncharacterized protein LOC125955445 [Anopheles darlingi]
MADPTTLLNHADMGNDTNTSQITSKTVKRLLESPNDNTNHFGQQPATKLIKIDDRENASPLKPNLSGIKSSLHGISYQLKLCIVMCLANAKKQMIQDPANIFSFKLTAEDPAAGKFDDIVFGFEDGEIEGTFKIQAKHKLDSPSQRLTLNDFITERVTNNPFAILQYLTSFYDQGNLMADKERLILCTNVDVSDSAKEIWKLMMTDDGSTRTLDDYILTLFSKIGAKCYRLDNDKPGGSRLEEFRQNLQKCSKLSRLAVLLSYATVSKEHKITQNNNLFKKYRKPISGIIDSSTNSSNGTYKFTKEFLDSSSTATTSDYKAFRKEFELQYKRILEKDPSCDIWNELKLKEKMW